MFLFFLRGPSSPHRRTQSSAAGTWGNGRLLGLKGLFVALAGMVPDVTGDELQAVEFREPSSGVVYRVAFAEVRPPGVECENFLL